MTCINCDTYNEPDDKVTVLSLRIMTISRNFAVEIPSSFFLLHKLDRIAIRVSHPRYPQFTIKEVVCRRHQRRTL